MLQPQKIQVLIANDQGLVREGLASVLSRRKDMDVLAPAKNLSQVVESFRRNHPHVLLIDLRLGGRDTIETIRKVHQDFPSTAILIVSNSDGSEGIHRALRAGARGYVLTDVSDSEIVEAIQKVSSGRRHISPQIAVKLAERMSRSTLTRRELEVLQLIVRGNSNKEIADALKVSEETVKYHVKGILSKLGVADRTQAATAALLRGIVHPQDL